MKNQSLDIFIPIINLAYGNFYGDFEKLPANKIYELLIDYPLNNPVTFKIKTGKRGMSLFKLLKAIGKAYNKVYEKSETYGIWGHDIDDLSLEGIVVNHKTRKITLDIGS